MRKVVGISGWKGSGKDTLADFLVQEYGFKKLSFARTLKDMVSREYDIPREWMDDPNQKETPLTQYPVIPSDPGTVAIQSRLSAEFRNGFWTPRAILIHEGTAKRAVHSNFWVRQVATVIAGTPDLDFVISDLRYKSEADTLKLLLPETHLVRIKRFDSVDTQDPSERDLDTYRFDTTLTNRGSVEEFYNSAGNMPYLSLDDTDDV